MGYAILMQWTPSAPGRTSTSDLVLSRVLEHYNITHPLRSSIQFRTFRATFPSTAEAPAPAPGPTRILTTVTYSQPIPPVRDISVPQGARDDCTYLFLEDRGVPVAAKPAEQEKADKPQEPKAEDKTEPKPEEKKDAAEQKEGKKDDEPIVIKDDDDDFEIIEAPSADPPSEPPASAPGPAPVAPASAAETAPATASEPPIVSRPRQKYKTLAVKPATLVMPTLHNLLSPFVLGLSKQARAGASTTGQAAAPTPLSGTPFVVTTLAFPPPSHPQPHLALSVHILPNAVSTIFLEAEWEGASPGPSERAVLEEFLRGCVPNGIPGESKIIVWDGEENVVDGWTGVEKTRRITSLLCRTLRESNII